MMRTKGLFGWLFLLIACVSSMAQPVQKDAALEALSGRWEGTMSMEGDTFPCSVQCEWILSGAFLQCDVRADRPTRKGTPVFSKREIVGPAGEGRYALYGFTDQGISMWGTREGAGRSWIYELSYSNGFRESGTFEWIDGGTIEMHATVMNADDEVVRTQTFRLRKVLPAR